MQKWGIDTSFMENCLKPIICPGGGNTPEERPEEKPEERPEEKPEEKPEQKPDVSGDGSSDKEESEALRLLFTVHIPRSQNCMKCNFARLAGAKMH